MGNPLLTFWARHRRREDEERRARRARLLAAAASANRASETIFLILRRMRAPLIVLIAIFGVSVLGLTLIPGQDAEGRPWDMGFFDAIYVMSYTATTIGFGEIPYPFTYNQRMWVTISIYLTVVGWAYAIGSLLGLLQDRAFRSALALQRFTRKVARLAEPFVLIAGYGRAGELLGHSMDALGRRVVVLDRNDERIDGLELESYHGDVPGLAADARDPGHLGVAGLDHTCCEAVVALTDDDEANLAVVMTTALLRPDLPVIARAYHPRHGRPHAGLRLAERGQPVRPVRRPRAAGAAGAGVLPAADLAGERSWGRPAPAGLTAAGRSLGGVRLRPARPGADRGPARRGHRRDRHRPEPARRRGRRRRGGGYEPAVLAAVGLEEAVGFVAGTDNDITNLSLVETARRANPTLFVAARQNRPSSAPLFAAMELDALLVPTEEVAHEVYAQLSTPLLWRFLRAMPALGDDWAADLVDRLTDLCGQHLQALWKVRLTPAEAPALIGWLASGEARLGDLLRNPEDRDEPLHAVPLLLLRGDDATLAPDPDFVLAPGDELLLAGWPAARRALGITLLVEAVREYVVTGRRVPSGWLWRRVKGTPAAASEVEVTGPRPPAPTPSR
jgi:Trk K+ transport system NAD-binding subunit